MSLVLIPVRVRATRADGTFVVGATVRAVLTVAETDDGLVVPGNITGVTDVNGEVTLNLWPNSRGVNGSQYRVEVSGANLYFSGLVTIPEAPSTAWPIALGTLINQPPYPSRTAAEVAQAKAQQFMLEAKGARDQAVPSGTAAVAAAIEADAARDVALGARDVVLAARDAAVLNVPIYSTIAAGLAAVANGAVFAVEKGGSDGLLRETRYRRDTVSAYTKLGEVFSAEEFDAVNRLLPREAGGVVVYAVVDAAGRRSWLEVSTTGGPTPDAGAAISKALQYANLAPGVKDVIDGKTSLADLPDLYAMEKIAFSIVDQSGRRSWLEANEAGAPTSHATAAIAAAINVLLAEATAVEYKASSTAVARPIVSGPDITCWGDSMTAGAGGGGTAFPAVLAGLSGRVVHNAGVGGETSVTICARSGATPFIVSVQGGTIPPIGGVTVSFEQINGQPVAPLLQGTGTPGGSFAGSLKGVSGTITQAGGVYTFTRAATGPAVMCNRPDPYYTDWAKARRNDIWVMWIGQNGPSDTRAIQDAKAMIQHLEALNKRWLVIPKPTSTDAFDSTMLSEFGRRVILARRYLVDYGLADAGITATPQDAAEIAAGVVPSSLRADAVHWTAAGYTILGNLVYQRMLELGWL